MPQRQKRDARRNRSGPWTGWRHMRLGLFGSAAVIAISIAYGVMVGGNGQEIGGRVATIADEVLAGAGFAIRDVTVTGRRYTLPHEILGALQISRGDPITAFDPQQARERVIALRWVREASVMRLLPDTIHVTIDEHRPLAIWQHSRGSTLIDDRGAVVSGFDVSTFPRLPVVVGPGAASAAPDFLSMLSTRPGIGERVRAAIRIGERRWNLKLDNGIDVLLPEEGVEIALDELIKIDERSGLLRRDIERVDLRITDRVVVLPRTGEGGNADGKERAASPMADRNT